MNSPIDSTTATADHHAIAADATDEDKVVSQPAVYVYEAPVRIWHWINALAIVCLALTGFFIGQPLPSVPGEAIDSFLMGYIRFIHFAAGYILAVGFIGRLYWAFVGNHHARQIFYVPLWSPKFWKEIFVEVRWYAFLEMEPNKYTGHNPLAHLVMFLAYTCLTVFMICTGFAMYAEGAGMDSWQYGAFGWVIDLAGNTQNLHTWHRVGMWVMVVFVMVHVYAAVREDIMSRQSIISSMISGWRLFKDDK